MARIRTVKPSFYRHLGLYEAEQETGLPLRVAYSGLWTSCDREGRFRWVPQELKLDCLPYDELDFSRVLDALWTRGFIVKYVVDDKEFGYVPTFTEHQVINHRESASVLPEPNENNILTREARVRLASVTRIGHAQGEGKGREGKESDAHASIVGFEKFWSAYPRKKSKGDAKRAWKKIKPDEHLQDRILRALERAKTSASWKQENGKYIPYPASWINAECWEDDDAAQVDPMDGVL